MLKKTLLTAVAVCVFGASSVMAQTVPTATPTIDPATLPAIPASPPGVNQAEFERRQAESDAYFARMHALEVERDASEKRACTDAANVLTRQDNLMVEVDAALAKNPHNYTLKVDRLNLQLNGTWLRMIVDRCKLDQQERDFERQRHEHD